MRVKRADTLTRLESLVGQIRTLAKEVEPMGFTLELKKAKKSAGDEVEQELNGEAAEEITDTEEPEPVPVKKKRKATKKKKKTTF